MSNCWSGVGGGRRKAMGIEGGEGGGGGSEHFHTHFHQIF